MVAALEKLGIQAGKHILELHQSQECSSRSRWPGSPQTPLTRRPGLLIRMGGRVSCVQAVHLCPQEQPVGLHQCCNLQKLIQGLMMQASIASSGEESMFLKQSHVCWHDQQDFCQIYMGARPQVCVSTMTASDDSQRHLLDASKPW